MLGIRLTMVVPNTMRLVEHDDGTFSVSVNIDEREFDTMSVMNAKQERAFWIEFQDRIELLSNEPDNLEGIEKAAKNRAEMLANGYASLMEKAKMNEKYGIMLSAFEDAGEEGLTLEELCEEEHDMGLGNGGLGRLAACFLDSMATLELPAIGYGIHYQFGLFRQSFRDGHQMESPDDWLKFGNPWEIVRPQYAQTVRLYGRVTHDYDSFGNYSPKWVETKTIEGIPYDVAIVGYGAKTVNFLRLWESKASQEFDFETFRTTHTARSHL